MDDIFVTGLSTENDEPINTNNITNAISSKIKSIIRPRNRKERRSAKKKAGKKGRQQIEKQDLIIDTAKKLNYIKLIQDLKELNKNKGEEQNEATEDRDSSV